MTIILDTSFLLALANAKDKNHQRVLEAARVNNNHPLVLPITVLPEICYLIGSRLGHPAMRHFLQNLAASNTTLEVLTLADLNRAIELLEIYADKRLDFVDATIVATAERLNVTQIFTLDRRDFTVIRPRHCQYFELSP